MQTKKDEIKEQIVQAAQREFLLHGYEGASMRVIARKANTTLGNIYHYYENKEAILTEILTEPLKGLRKMLEGHMKLQTEVYSMQELLEVLNEAEDLMDYEEFQYLMDKRLLILFELKTTHFAKERDEIICDLKKQDRKSVV